MALIARDYDNVRLTGFVREVPQRTGAILNTWLPDREVGTRTFSIKTTTRANDSAVFRAFDTPSPVAPRPGFTEKVGSLPPISEMMVIGEDERLGIYERAIAGDFDEQVDGAIYDDATTMTRRIRNRFEIARGQVLSTGTFVLAGENNMYLTADFGMPAANLPGGHASTTAALTWADEDADILGEITTLQERSRDENGSEIGALIMSSARISNLLGNLGIRAILANNGVTPSIATEANVQAVLSAHGLPTFVRYDYQVSGTRVIPADLVVAVPSPDAEEFGRTEFGVTAEALVLDLDFSDNPGLVGLVMTSDDPVGVYTKVAALGMPVLHQPELLYVFDAVP
jgi:hypothetical protein